MYVCINYRVKKFDKVLGKICSLSPFLRSGSNTMMYNTTQYIPYTLLCAQVRSLFKNKEANALQAFRIWVFILIPGMSAAIGLRFAGKSLPGLERLHTIMCIRY